MIRPWNLGMHIVRTRLQTSGGCHLAKPLPWAQHHKVRTPIWRLVLVQMQGLFGIIWTSINPQ